MVRVTIDSVGECATQHITLSITFGQSYDSRFCSTINFIKDYFRQQSLPYRELYSFSPEPSSIVIGGISR